MALGLTASVSLTLTLFAFQTKWDFTMMGEALRCATVILLILGVAAIFIRSKILQLVYGCTGALIFCTYLVYDTQRMMYNISPEKYIYAALTPFLDIVSIFLYINAASAA